MRPTAGCGVLRDLLEADESQPPWVSAALRPGQAVMLLPFHNLLMYPIDLLLECEVLTKSILELIKTSQFSVMHPNLRFFFFSYS